jgi:thiosulfate/3-mercaptopyruvate sulfurtransferase
MSSNLVSTTWLADHLDDSELVVLDATWLLPPLKRDAKAEFGQAHIPGAQFFDLDAVSEQDTSLPHMLPKPGMFAAKVGALGAGDGKKIVAYDSLGIFSAARCWWMFKAFGHDNVAVLDGGLKAWLAEGRPLETGAARVVKPVQFTAALQSGMVWSIDEVAKGAAQIVDARPTLRFTGEAEEPRPGVTRGHIPGSVNVPFGSVVTADGRLKSAADLSNLFLDAGINQSKPIVTSCGSGVTAALLSLCLTETGAKEHALYDGSWAEWGTSGQEVETGA